MLKDKVQVPSHIFRKDFFYKDTKIEDMVQLYFDGYELTTDYTPNKGKKELFAVPLKILDLTSNNSIGSILQGLKKANSHGENIEPLRQKKLGISRWYRK